MGIPQNTTGTRPTKGLFVVGLVIAVALFLAASVLWTETILLWNNTLDNNGRWISGKSALEMPVMAPLLYMATNQALARGHLNLGAWHGFQEMWFHEPIHHVSVSFNFWLPPGAYLSFLTGKQNGNATGIRFSAWPELGSAVFTVQDTGEFTSITPLEIPPLLLYQWNRVVLKQNPNGATLSLNGQPVPLPDSSALLFNGVGFRGCYQNVLVDYIVIEEQGSGRIVTERFRNTRHRTALYLCVILAFLLLNAVTAAFALRRGAQKHTVPLWMALVSFNLLNIAVFTFVYLYYTQERYPALFFDNPRAIAWRDRDIEDTRARIAALDPVPEANLERILVLGTSQTQGSGALRKQEAYTEQLQQMLTEAFPEGPLIECIRAGISAGDSTILLGFYEREWLNIHPSLVILNLGNNDTDAGVLAANLDRVIEMNQQKGIQTLLALEANTMEKWPGQLPMHPVIREAAEKQGVPYVDLHAYLMAHIDKGFLWWDFVHPTSFGHKLIAQRLFQAIHTRNLLGVE